MYEQEADVSESTDTKAEQERKEYIRKSYIRAEQLRKRKEQILSFQTIGPGWQTIEECFDEPDGQRSFVLSPVIGFVLVSCPGHRDDYDDYINYEIRPVISNEIGQEISECPVIPPGFDDKDIPSFMDQMGAPSRCVRYFVQDGDDWQMVDHLPDDPKSEE